jgi:uncharacterized protein
LNTFPGFSERVLQAMSSVADPIKAPTPRAGPDTALGSALCTQCGLCCNGALHNFAKLDADEVDYASRIGLTVRPVGPPGFALPCPMLKDSMCTIYGNRPKACVRYKCQLLQDLEAGSVTLEAAIGTVGTAKELVRQAEDLLPGEMTLPGARMLIPTSEPELPRSTADMPLRLAITALSLYLDKHFKHSREAKTLSIEPIAEGRIDPEMT